MKNFVIPVILAMILIISGCSLWLPFYDDEPKIAEKFSSILSNINWIWKDIISQNLSWKLETIKDYAQEYYTDVMQEYLDKAKSDLSWSINDLKIKYNEWIDDLSNTINDKITTNITDELNKLKL